MRIQGVTSKKVKHLVKDRELFWLPPSATVEEASILMRERNIGAVAILDDGKLVGIVSERDVVQRCIGREGVEPRSMKVEQIMSHPPIVIDRNMSMGVAIVMMMENNIRHLPVMNDSKIIGMISIRQLVQEFQRGLEAQIFRLAA